jgi:hypothetical protein
MVHQKRKAQHEIDENEAKRFRQNPPSAYRQTNDGKHQNLRGGRARTHQAHTHDQVQEQLHQIPQQLVAQSMQQVLGSAQQHGLPQLPHQLEIKALKPKQQEPKPDPFVPYSELRIPILYSTKIDHSSNLTLQKDQWDTTVWKNYYNALVMVKVGINREQLGLPVAKEGCGSPVTIDHVDLHLDLGDDKVYVAASERGLMAVPDYLKLCGIAPERKLRFTGKTPYWAKTVFDAAEKRYVTEAFGEIPLPVRSEVHVLEKFQMTAGTWGCMYSAHLKKVIQFPLAYTSDDREFAMVKGCPGPLSAVELKHVFALPEKEPTPQELGEALFAQAEQCDRDALDLQMTKTRDDYLHECGYLYGKYAPANTQQKKGIFFESPPFEPIEDDGKFVIFEKGKKGKETYFVEWNRDCKDAPAGGKTNPKPPSSNASLPENFRGPTKKHMVAASKQTGAPSMKAPCSTPSRKASVPKPEETAEKRGETALTRETPSSQDSSLSPPTDQADDDARAHRLQDLRQKLVAKRANRTPRTSSASSSTQSASAADEQHSDVPATEKLKTYCLPSTHSSSPSRKRRQSSSPSPPSKRTKTTNDNASPATDALPPTTTLLEESALPQPKPLRDGEEEGRDASAINPISDLAPVAGAPGQAAEPNAPRAGSIKSDVEPTTTCDPSTHDASHNHPSPETTPPKDVREAAGAETHGSGTAPVADGVNEGPCIFTEGAE